MSALADEASFEVRRPTRSGSAFVFASPHSGCRYPSDMGARASLNAISLGSAEDTGVDQLVDTAPGLGIPLILAHVSRTYVDLNRAPTDLDPLLIRDVPAIEGSGTAGAKVAAGYGVIPRKTGDGQDLYDRSLSLAEAEARLQGVHQPYHVALGLLMQEARAQNGFAVLLDWHSMPGSIGTRRSGARGPDVVLGDRHGTSCDVRLTRRLRSLFEEAGWSVALNRPFAGGYTTQTWGRPDQNFHAIQIELSRALYLDEITRNLSPAHSRCRGVIGRLAKNLSDSGWPL